VLLERRVKHIQDGMIEFAQGEPLTADLVVWATGAAAPPTLQRLGLPTDERGFLLTRSTLQSTGADCVFAVGDTGTMQHAPTPKAGVYAVRQGPVLWNNLQRFLRGEALEEYRPQSDFLKLINTGDGRAIAEYKHCSSHARWCWHLKDRIDRGFMQKYQDYQPMPMQMPIASNSKDAAVMQCAGCGSKLGSSVLSQALAQLPIAEHPQIKIGLDQPDDAAVMRPLANQAITVTVDFFPAPLDDPYLVGRLAALNAASDLFAMGAKPVAALAMVTLPAGPEKRQAELLIELLRGARRELDLMRAVLAGGHTTEGERLTIGFSMIGNQTCEPPLTKAGLRPGDRLLLTKPLGSGVLLAAHMRARCDAHSMRELLDTMLTSNQLAAELAIAAGVRAMTDVTGFGLAGHLYEMLRASNVSAKLDLDHLPVLAAAPSLIASGIESTLAPSNRHVESAIAVDSAKRLSPAYSLLFDPQTSGGLLIAVAPERADSLRRELHQAGYFHTAEIGVVDSASSETAGASRLVI
jgi:selenide,water dikinase